jgi:hypothetical protein
MTKVEKTVYKLALIERFTRVGQICPMRSKLMEVDGIGLYVYHSEEHPYYITPGLVRRHLIGGRSTFCLVEADSEEEAKQIFLTEWDGAKCGSRSPALRIADDAKIIKYPHCDLMYKNRRGEYTCGRPIHDIEGHEDQHNPHWNDNGEFGMCAIGGYDCPEGCPLYPRGDEEQEP